MAVDVNAWIKYSWEAVGLVWLVGAAFTKRTVHVQSFGPRLFYLALAVLGFGLLFSNWFRQGWLGTRVIQDWSSLRYLGLGLTVAGCMFAIWARLKLGGNWSGRATVKEGHQLVTSGPYALARHPIYTGFLTAAVGTALASGEVHDLLALVVIVMMLMLKMSQEERLMVQTFPTAYPAYRRRVKALIPGAL